MDKFVEYESVNGPLRATAQEGGVEVRIEVIAEIGEPDIYDHYELMQRTKRAYEAAQRELAEIAIYLV